MSSESKPGDDLKGISSGYINKQIKKLRTSTIPLRLKYAINEYATRPRMTLLFPIDHLQYPYDIIQKSILFQIHNLYHKIVFKIGNNYIHLYLKNNQYSINTINCAKLQTIKTENGLNWKYSTYKYPRKNFKILFEMDTNGRIKDESHHCQCKNTNGDITIYIYQDYKENTPSKTNIKRPNQFIGQIKLNMKQLKPILSEDEVILFSYGIGNDVDIFKRYQYYCNCNLLCCFND